MKQSGDWILYFMAVLAILIFAYIWAASAAQAQGNVRCGNYEKLVEALQNQHNEYKAWQGVTPSGQSVFELFRSDSGSWTIVMRSTAKGGCLMAAGEGGHVVPPVPTPKPDPSERES